MIALNNPTESFKTRLNYAEKRISDLGHWAFKIIQSEEQKRKK